MAVEVKAGETYNVDFCRNGESWSLFRVKAEKGPKELAVFTTENLDLSEGDRVRVDKITGVKLSARKDNRGEWRDTFSVNVEAVKLGGAPKGFQDIDDSDGTLPF
jgi:hypothetical protein